MSEEHKLLEILFKVIPSAKYSVYGSFIKKSQILEWCEDEKLPFLNEINKAFYHILNYFQDEKPIAIDDDFNLSDFNMTEQQIIEVLTFFFLERRGTYELDKYVLDMNRRHHCFERATIIFEELDIKEFILNSEKFNLVNLIIEQSPDSHKERNELELLRNSLLEQDKFLKPTNFKISTVDLSSDLPFKNTNNKSDKINLINLLKNRFTRITTVKTPEKELLDNFIDVELPKIETPQIEILSDVNDYDLDLDFDEVDYLKLEDDNKLAGKTVTEIMDAEIKIKEEKFETLNKIIKVHYNVVEDSCTYNKNEQYDSHEKEYLDLKRNMCFHNLFVAYLVNEKISELYNKYDLENNFNLNYKEDYKRYINLPNKEENTELDNSINNLYHKYYRFIDKYKSEFINRLNIIKNENKKEVILEEKLKIILHKDFNDEELGGYKEIVKENIRNKHGMKISNGLILNKKCIMPEHTPLFFKMPYIMVTETIINQVMELKNSYPHFSEIIDFLVINLKSNMLFGDGVMNIKPILLYGQNGIGKSAFIHEISEILDLHGNFINMGSVMTTSELCGLDSGFGTAKPGFFVNGILKNNVVNPILILDELDKVVTSGHNGKVQAPLYDVLETKSSQKFQESYFHHSFDFSHINFMATCNSLDTIDKGVIDRFTLFTVELPTIEMLPAIIKSVYTTLKKDKMYRPVSITEVELEKFIKNCQMKNINNVRQISKMIGNILMSSIASLTINKSPSEDVSSHYFPAAKQRTMH